MVLAARLEDLLRDPKGQQLPLNLPGASMPVSNGGGGGGGHCPQAAPRSPQRPGPLELSPPIPRPPEGLSPSVRPGSKVPPTSPTSNMSPNDQGGGDPTGDSGLGCLAGELGLAPAGACNLGGPPDRLQGLSGS